MKLKNILFNTGAGMNIVGGILMIASKFVGKATEVEVTDDDFNEGEEAILEEVE